MDLSLVDGTGVILPLDLTADPTPDIGRELDSFVKEHSCTSS